MAEMNFYKYPQSIKAMYTYKAGVASLKKPIYDVLYKGLNGVCAVFLDGFDESNNKNWLGLMKPPVDIERAYLIDPAQATEWKKNYKKDQKRLKENYKKIVEELKKKRLSPLALRAEIQKQLEKNPKLRHHVDNPIEEKEIDSAYNRYMEGQSIRFNSTKAHKDLLALKDAVKKLADAFTTVKTTLPSDIDFDSAIAGLLAEESLLTEIKGAIEVCEQGWVTVISTLTSGQAEGVPLTKQQAKRLVSRWVGNLRRLRGKCQTLVSAINLASSKLTLSSSAMGTHLLNHCTKEAVNMTHREFMYWATMHLYAGQRTSGNSGTHILADAYKAVGWERQMWADDFSIKSVRNNDFWISRDDKLDYEKWFAHLGMSYSWTAGLEMEDFVLSHLGGVPKQQLFDIAYDYIVAPTNTKHTL